MVGGSVIFRYIDWPYSPANTNTAPSISAISDRSGPVDVPFVILFMVSDLETPLSKLAFRLSSSDPKVIPNGGVTYDRTGINPVATVTARAHATGTVTLTLRVTDEGGLFAETPFTVTITP